MPIYRWAIIDHRHIIGPTALNRKLLAARCNIRMAGQNTLAMRSLFDSNLAQAVEAGIELAVTEGRGGVDGNAVRGCDCPVAYRARRLFG